MREIKGGEQIRASDWVSLLLFSRKLEFPFQCQVVCAEKYESAHCLFFSRISDTSTIINVPVCALAHALSIYKSHSVFGTLVTHTHTVWQPQYCQYQGAEWGILLMRDEAVQAACLCSKRLKTSNCAQSCPTRPLISTSNCTILILCHAFWHPNNHRFCCR